MPGQASFASKLMPLPHPAGALVLVMLAGGFGGCAPKRPAPPPPGPTEPMAMVLQRLIANNSAIPTLYARHYLEANIVQEGRTRFVNAEGDLFLLKPRSFYLRATKVLDKIFEMGSTEEVFWLTIYADENKRWWGHHRNVGRPCAEEIPIRPDLVGEVLGVSDIDPDFTVPPVPTMRYNNDLDVYMITWHAPLPDRWITEKEIWYDRANLRPQKVLLFDRDGRPVLRANLSGHQPVEVPGQAREQWPVVATAYHLLFPETGSTMTLRLSDVVLKNRVGQPRAGMIAFRDDPAAESIQLDRNCER